MSADRSGSYYPLGFDTRSNIIHIEDFYVRERRDARLTHHSIDSDKLFAWTVLLIRHRQLVRESSQA